MDTKFSATEMLFAAQVRELVSTRIRRRIPDDATEDQRQEILARPANDVIIEVLRELEGFAAVIAKHRQPA